MIGTYAFIGLLGLLSAHFQDNVAIKPADRLGEDWWKQRHEHCVELTKQGGFDLVFLGDSITQGWEGGGKAVWDREYAPLKAANFGFSGDRTEHVLWRLDHGELLGLKPKVIVIMIGTNNVGHGSSNPQQTSVGVKAIIGKLLTAIPTTKILLLGVFPRSNQPDDGMRKAVDQINGLIKGFADGKRVFWDDIGYAFLRPDGTLRTPLMPDQLHPNDAGYEIWAKAMKPELDRLMGGK